MTATNGIFHVIDQQRLGGTYAVADGLTFTRMGYGAT
jgi:hypothetical protein